MEYNEEWQKLADIIQRWNKNRLDLFEISLPCKNLEFHGVMRFYFEDHEAGNVASKCLRVSSTINTGEVVETLSEKFRPDMKMLNTCYYLYEVRANHGERQLDLSERPLVVQLNWKTDDRNRRFVLKREKEIIRQNDKSPEEKEKRGIMQNFKRTLSRKEKKEKKKTGDDSVENLTNSSGSTIKKENRQISPPVAVDTLSNKDIVTECLESSRWSGIIKPMVWNQKQHYGICNERIQDIVDHLALPVGIKFRENSEDTFLATVINYTNSSTVHFKLSPAYVLYMTGRFVFKRHHSTNQDTWQSPLEHAHRVTATVDKMVAMTEVVIQKQNSIAGVVTFWMANTSELLNFFKQDRDLSPITQKAQENLAHLVKKAFKYLLQCLLTDLTRHMPTFLVDPEDQSQPPAGIEGVLNTLMGAMSLLRRCRVNAALTIQLFSQLFHSISTWLLNRLLNISPQGQACSLGLRSHYWGATLRQRLSLVEEWAERQGLELAADCHLSHIIQATMLLTMNKYSMEDVENIQKTCFKLNSLQLRTLMTSYLCASNEPQIPHGVIEKVVAAAEASADEVVRSEGRSLQLEEAPDLNLPFLLPEEGYSCDSIRGIPQGFREFLEPICRKGLCTLISHPQADGTWNIYFNRANGSSVQETNLPIHNEPEVMNITLRKPLKSGLGVSIVAAKGAGQSNLGIYIKSIVKGGAAEMDGRLTAGDQLLCVDGQSLLGQSQERAASILLHTGPVVSLQVAKQGAVYHGLAALLDEPPSVASPDLDCDGPNCSSPAKLDARALILFDGMGQGPEPSGLWGNNQCGNNRSQREQTLLKNRQLYRSNPNIINQAFDEGEPVDPVITTNSKMSAVSTSNLLGSDMYHRVYLTLPEARSQEKKTVAFDLPPQMPRASFNLDGQVSNKKTLMRQALSQENLCTDSDHPLVDRRYIAPNLNHLESYYSSLPMKHIVSTNLHSNVRHSATTKQSSCNTASGYWRTPTSNNQSSVIHPIRIDIPVTQPANSQPRTVMTTFQQTPTLLAVNLNQDPECKGRALPSNLNEGSHSKLKDQLRRVTCTPSSFVSTRKSQPSLTSTEKTKPPEASTRSQPQKSKLLTAQSKDTTLQRRPAKQQPVTAPGHQDQYFSMNKEQRSGSINGLSPDPWKRDAREKQQKLQRLQVVGLLEGEVQNLQSKAQLTPEENDRLRRLHLEWHFQKKLQEFQQNGGDDEDRDTSTEGSVQGSDEINENVHKKWSKEGPEENIRGNPAPENLTFKERQHLFSPLGSNVSIKVEAL